VTGQAYLLAVIAVMAAATLLTRALPFLLLRRTEHPLVFYLGRHLPPAVMLLLVLYSVREMFMLPSMAALAYPLAVAVTAGLHLWRRNSLLSMAGGTALFMGLQQSGLLVS
jgi:branched-subunit amino acid transport protein AzlD